MPTHATLATGWSMTPSTPTLPTTHAFVVQFRAETAIAHGHILGRVEHVMSGQATQFGSLDDLVGFFAQVLMEVRAPLRRRPRKKK